MDSHRLSLVLIRGGGEMGSGVAWRLHRCGFRVIIAEVEKPTAIRRWVSFSEAIYDGEHMVEGITARHIADPAVVESVIGREQIPVVVCPNVERLTQFSADVIVDAILAKRNTGLRRGMARRTIGLGPGFTADGDVDCAIETNRGPGLGRCIWQGQAEPDTGVPGLLGGETSRRLLRAPATGQLETVRAIGDALRAGDLVARVDSAEVRTRLDGVLRGLMRSGAHVQDGMKIGDVDPRGDIELCRRISDKALAIAGGVLEAILSPDVDRQSPGRPDPLPTR